MISVLSPAEWIVFGLVLAGFTVQGATGFGAGIVSLSLSALVFPLDQLLPTFIPLALTIAITLSFKERRHLAAGTLLKKVIPVVLPSAAVGLVIFASLDVQTLLPFFGVLALGLGVFELLKTFRREQRARETSPLVDNGLLVVGGVAHGMFASGGPLIALTLTRLVPDKRAFRATVSGMWVLLNGAMLATYLWRGLLTTSTLRLSALLLPALIGGLVLGEVVIRRLPELWFRRVVLAIVSLAGASLVGRALFSAAQ